MSSVSRSFLTAALTAALLASEADRSAAQPTAAPRYLEHQDLSYFLHPDGSRAEIRRAADWSKRRRHILLGMEEAMGRLPKPVKPTPLDVEIVEEERGNGVIRRKLAYHTDQADQQVKAWLLVPNDDKLQRRPAILCLHQTTPAGKDSPVGLADRPSLHYALELALRGYVTLSPDYPSLGEYDYDFDADQYGSGSMKAIYDNIRAIDLLQSLPEVDPDRIGCIGHSLGGHNGLFTAVFDERIKVVATSCGFTSFHKYKGGNLHGWSGPRYMPRVATLYNFSPDQMPFDFHEVVAAIAPRAIFVVAPLLDDNFDVNGVRDVLAAAGPVYELLDRSEKLRVLYPNCGHDFPSSSRDDAFAFFDRHLMPTK